MHFACNIDQRTMIAWYCNSYIEKQANNFQSRRINSIKCCGIKNDFFKEVVNYICICFNRAQWLWQFFDGLLTFKM